MISLKRIYMIVAAIFLITYKKTINGETVLVLPSNSPYIQYLMGDTR